MSNCNPRPRPRPAAGSQAGRIFDALLAHGPMTAAQCEPIVGIPARHIRASARRSVESGWIRVRKIGKRLSEYSARRIASVWDYSAP